MLPIDNTIPDSLYVVKKMFKPLGLDYLMIHACKNNCIIYWKEYENLETCQKYGESS